jgi:hypothetical protein
MSRAVGCIVALILALTNHTVCAGTAIFSIDYDEGNPTYMEDDLPLKQIKPVRVTASSTLKSNKNSHEPKQGADGNAATAWCEGSEGNGVGEWLLFEFSKQIPLTVIEFTPFYAKSRETLANNNRIKRMKIEMEGGISGVVEFMDASWCSDCQLQYPAPYINFHTKKGPRFFKTQWIKFTVLDVYPGRKYTDTCISDIQISEWCGK